MFLFYNFIIENSHNEKFVIVLIFPLTLTLIIIVQENSSRTRVDTIKCNVQLFEIICYLIFRILNHLLYRLSKCHLRG